MSDAKKPDAGTSTAEWVAYTPRACHAYTQDRQGRTPHRLGLRRVVPHGRGGIAPANLQPGQPWVEELSDRRTAEVLDHLRRAPDPHKAKEDLVILDGGQPWPARLVGKEPDGTAALDVYPPVGGLVLHESGVRLREAAPAGRAGTPGRRESVTHAYRPLQPGEQLDFPWAAASGPAPAPGGGIASVEVGLTLAATWSCFQGGQAPGEHLAPASGLRFAAELTTKVPNAQVGYRGSLPCLGCDQVFRLRWVLPPGGKATLDLLGMTNVLGRQRCRVARLRAYLARLLVSLDDALLPDDCGGEVLMTGLDGKQSFGVGAGRGYADASEGGFHPIGKASRSSADGPDPDGGRSVDFLNVDEERPAAVDLALFGCSD